MSNCFLGSSKLQILVRKFDAAGLFELPINASRQVSAASALEVVVEYSGSSSRNSLTER